MVVHNKKDKKYSQTTNDSCNADGCYWVIAGPIVGLFCVIVLYIAIRLFFVFKGVSTLSKYKVALKLHKIKMNFLLQNFRNRYSNLLKEFNKEKEEQIKLFNKLRSKKGQAALTEFCTESANFMRGHNIKDDGLLGKCK